MSSCRCVWMFLFTLSLLINFHPANANMTPVGEWLTFDDFTHEKRGIIELWLKDNQLYGSVKKIWYRPGDAKYCVKCPGRFKNKKLQGLTIIWGLKQDENGEWVGGQVLDPERGQIFNMKMRIASTGDKLFVRGYLGFSLLGRTQVWQRVD